jgi:hypothetical protein
MRWPAGSRKAAALHHLREFDPSLRISNLRGCLPIHRGRSGDVRGSAAEGGVAGVISA